MRKYRISLTDRLGRSLASMELKAMCRKDAAEEARKTIGAWVGCNVSVVPMMSAG
jgi:hypothetical protein